MIVAVLFGVLLIHLITDFVRNRCETWKRRRKLLANTTVLYSQLENGHISGEESDCAETTLLVCDQETFDKVEHRSVSSSYNIIVWNYFRYREQLP